MAIEEGIIEEIDLDTGLVAVRFNPSESASFLVNHIMPYYSDVTGSMLGAMPVVGDYVVTVRPEGHGNRYVIGYKAMPHEEGDDDADGLNQFLGNRYPMTPGDIIMSGSKHNRVLVEASGDVEIASHELTMTRWSETDDRIQNIALNFEISGFYGVAEWFTDRDEARETKEITPTGFRAAYKRTAEGPPLVYQTFGAVLDEEGDTHLGEVTNPETLLGELVHRTLIFDEATALKFANHKRYPAPEAANYQMRMDDLGNSEQLQQGVEKRVVSGFDSVCRGNYSEDVWGHCEILGAKGLRLASGDSLDIHASKDVTIRAGRNLTLSCDELTIESRSRKEAAVGPLTLATAETLTLDAGGDLLLSAKQSSIHTTGKDHASVIRGTRTTVVQNANPMNIAQDTASDLLRVYGGKLKHHVEQGSYEVTVGPENSPVARIKVFMDPKTPQQLGRIHIGFPQTNSGLTMSPDGAWELKGLSGGIRSDVAGNITLGNPNVPVVGNVVTTLTHPTDYFTGLPINGHTQVTVTAGAPAPLVGSPSLGVVPPTVTLPEILPK